MAFDPVDPRQSFPALERGILKYWKEEDIFKRSLHNRHNGETFTFYDGPPFATGLPHYGHLLAGTIKDVIPRYQTMRGKYVERRFGWDCHGLPIENLIEKEQGLGSKRDIEAMGVAAFNDLCRSSVQRYTKEWRATVERMGRFVDMDWDYRTMDAEYMESIFWVFAQLWEKGLVYEGHKPMHLCPRCATPLSNFEVTQGYKDITDQSATVQFELEDEPGTYVLAWTTTPWTLPGNLFLAIGPHITYVSVECDGKRYILAKERVEAVFAKREHTVGKTVTHKELVGKIYKPLFPYFVDRYKDSAFRIVAADFVETGEGTGVVHIAPGFGEDDYAVGKKEKVPLLQHVTIEGKFVPEVTDFAGLDVKPKDDPTKADQKVIAWLEANGKLFERIAYKHSYPHCWRCDSPLLNYATSSWFVAVEKIKDDMLAANAKTEWVPSHLRDGRFGKWLEGARDWAVSRNRYWGTPLPLWRADGGDKAPIVIGSRNDLMLRSRIRFTKLTAVRHGESEGNLVPIYQGKQPGTSLTKRGKEQATATGKRLAEDDVPVDVIYCSPLDRTKQTAELIAKATGAQVIVDDRLRELSFGDYEGKTVDFSDLAFVKARRAHKIDQNQVESIYHFAGMEDWTSVQERIADFLNDVLPRHRSQHVVVVTHADPVQNIRHFFSKEDFMKLGLQPYPDYAEPYTFFWDHDTQRQLDLHKEFVDGIVFCGEEDDALPSLTLVRHGETEFNAKKLLQGGRENPPLNDTGRAQALETAKKLTKQSFDGIVVSTLARAKETAEILSKHLGIPIVAETPLLNERDGGAWSGRSEADVIAEVGEHAAGGGNISFHQATPPDGESLSVFLRRAQDAYDYLQREYPGRSLLVVTHGGTIRALRTLVENLSYAEASATHVHNAESVALPKRRLLKRIPEVFDCWFESGSMPFAQEHFPFEGDTKSSPGFPADFIAEGIDQTRGWFYTLTVLAAALFRKPAFQHCITNGTVLAEDGRKMSKRLQNYPDPNEVMEEAGADALRFALMSSPAVRGDDMRFSKKTLDEAMRNILLPLWNAYGFFVTYANAAGFAPTGDRRHSAHPLDVWIRAEVQDLSNRMTEQLENYDLSATCAELHDTVDALTNWYIRLSRRRFAGKLDNEEGESAVSEEQQHDALATLHDVLVTVTQLLAPFCPFIADAMYLNLVPESHGSVHLTDWPDTKTLSKEEQALLSKTHAMRVIVSLGLKLRSQKTIKVRQPLSRATVALPPNLAAKLKLSPEDEQLLRQELNVKELVFTKDAGSLGESIVQVDARKVGPRLGGRVQEIIAAGKRGEFEERPDGTIVILDESLGPEEASVVYRGREGTDVAAEKGIVMGLDTHVDDTLKAEGLARDMIRAVQTLRKEAGLAYTDTIVLKADGLPAELGSHWQTILTETRAKDGDTAENASTIDLDGTAVKVFFAKV